ncbi:MAG: hypothetical protein M3301_05080 [Chloroflexota bacterium]|nr:hypothetical protein [Chloroflexota bacterium]
MGWTAITLLLVAALIGLAGEGPLSLATASDEGAGFQVEYYRSRHGSPEQLKIRVREPATRGGEVRVSLDREYVEGVVLEAVVPEPDTVQARTEWIVYAFTVEPAQGSTTVTFNVTHQKVGLVAVRVALGDGAPVTFSQFVYP